MPGKKTARQSTPVDEVESSRVLERDIIQFLDIRWTGGMRCLDRPCTDRRLGSL